MVQNLNKYLQATRAEMVALVQNLERTKTARAAAIKENRQREEALTQAE